MSQNTTSTSKINQVKATIGQIDTAAVEAYRDSGLGVLFPLPFGEKKEPPRGVTGKSVTPEAAAQKAEQAWETAPAESNAALRLAPNVLVLDEDAHGGKPGAKTKKALESKLGSLPDTSSCTRHGAQAESRHYYFKAPENLEWKPEAKVEIDGKTSGAIDVRHMRLSYTVVWPSQYEGDTYQWYTPSGELAERPPRVEELAELPQEWVEYLSTGEVSDAAAVAPTECYNFAEAMEWLEPTASSYDGEPGAIFQSEFGAGKEDGLIARFEGSAHPTMVERQTWAVKLAVFEGEAGLGSVLSTLEEMFCEAVSRRATHSAAVREWRSALTGAVNLVRGEAQAGRKTWKAKTAGVEALDAVSITGAREVGNAVEEHEKAISDAIRYRSSAAAVADLVALQCPELVTVRRKDEEDLILNLDTGSKLTEGDLREILDGPVTEAVRGFRAVLVKVEDTEVEDDGEMKANDVAKEIGSLFRAGRLTALYQNVANSIRKAGRVLAAEKLDKNAELFGCGDDVLDLALARKNPDGDLSNWLRRKEYEDAVTKSMPINGEALRDGMASLAHRRASSVVSQRETHTERLIETIFPDAEDRRFAQKALGYAISGDSDIDLFMVWYGSGGGGKNSLFKSIGAALGKDYTSQLTVEQFLKGSANRPDPQVTKAWGTPFTLVDEAESGQKVDAAAIKKATGSRTARRLHDNNYVETDSNTIAIATNQVFQFKHDSGVERRLVVLPFDAAEEDIIEVQPPAVTKWRERDEEIASMLLWLAEGYVMAMEEGLAKKTFPPNIAKATARFIEAADPTQAFFRKLERTGDPEDFLATADLAKKLREVAGEYGAEAIPKNLGNCIRDWFKDQGHEGDKCRLPGGGARGYRGWRLNEGTVLHLPPMTLPEEIEEAS